MQFNAISFGASSSLETVLGENNIRVAPRLVLCDLEYFVLMHSAASQDRKALYRSGTAGQRARVICQFESDICDWAAGPTLGHTIVAEKNGAVWLVETAIEPCTKTLLFQASSACCIERDELTRQVVICDSVGKTLYVEIQPTIDHK